MDYQHQLILCIVDEGFSDIVMDAAISCGATGGTVIHAKGTAPKDAERYFNITIQPYKEIVMILVPTEIRDNVLHALYANVGLNTQGHGIAFALPVDNVVGISKTLPTMPNETLQSESEDKKDIPSPTKEDVTKPTDVVDSTTVSE